MRLSVSVIFRRILYYCGRRDIYLGRKLFINNIIFYFEIIFIFTCYIASNEKPYLFSGCAGSFI